MAGPPVHSRGDKPDASSRCRAQECCKRRPFFGPPGGKPLFCAQHSKKSEGMVDVSSRRCEHEGCAKWPLYGNEGQKAKFCSMHKEPTMIDVRSRRCAAPGCKRQPSYGFEGSRACFCAAHKEPGMVDVVSRRCEGPHCRRRPLYGFEGQKSQFCSAHKQEGQVDVCNRRCQQQSCSKRPCFGFPGQQPIFCGTHRTSDMVDVISHKCSYPGCSHPTGYEANRIRSKFCEKHKSVGLAGASLLQLAGSAVDGNSAGTRPTGSAAHGPGYPSPKKSTSCVKGPESQARSVVATNPKKSDTSEVKGATKGNPVEDSQESEKASSASSRRLAICAAPREGAEQASMLEDKFTHSAATPLPPLGSILEGSSSKGRSKRPREGDGKSRDDAHVNQSPPQPPPVPGEGDFSAAAPSVTNDRELGDSKKPTGERAESGSGGADGSRRCGSSGGSSRAPNVLCVEPEHGLSKACEDSKVPKPSGGAKRLFPGSPKDVLGWRRAWEGTKGTDHVGFLSSALSADWRSKGLAATGRAVSFDEMQAAAGREVLEPGPDEQPRRASAFLVGTDVLPPVVTEVGRRESALEPRAPSPKTQIGHYRDLLSAGQHFRSGLSSTGALSRHLSKQGAVAEVQEEPSGSDVATLSRSGGGSSALWTPASPNQWISRENAENSRLDRRRAPSRQARLFHVMSPATPFMGVTQGGGSGDGPRLGILQKRMASQNPEQQASGDQTGAGSRLTSVPGKIDGSGSVDPAGTIGVDRETGSKTTPSQHRRRSLMESSSHSPWSRTHQGREETTAEGAIPIPCGRGTLGKQSPSFGGLGDAGAEVPHRLLPLRRTSKLGASQDVEAIITDAVDLRRHSLPTPNGASTLDEGNGAPPIAFVPAWGAPVGDDQNHDMGLGENGNATARETPAAPASRPNRPSGRRGALSFGVERGAGGDRERRGLGALFGGTRRHPGSVPSPGKREALGGLSRRRGWGPMEQDSVPPPETSDLVNRYVPAWGAPVDEGGQDAGDQSNPGTRRSSRGDELSSFASADDGHERRRLALGTGEGVAGETSGLANNYVPAWGAPVDEGGQDAGDQNNPVTRRSSRGDELSSFASADDGHERRRSVLGIGEGVAGETPGLANSYMPAWGAPVDEGGQDAGDQSNPVTWRSSHGDELSSFAPADDGHERRRSVLGTGEGVAGETSGLANSYVPAWGSSVDEGGQDSGDQSNSGTRRSSHGDELSSFASADDRHERRRSVLGIGEGVAGETPGLANSYVPAWGAPVDEGRQDVGNQSNPGSRRSSRGDELSSFASADDGHERRRSVLSIGEGVAGVPGCPVHPGVVHPGALTSPPRRRRALALGFNPQNPLLS